MTTPEVVLTALGLAFIVSSIIWYRRNRAAIEAERREVREIAEAHTRGRK